MLVKIDKKKIKNRNFRQKSKFYQKLKIYQNFSTLNAVGQDKSIHIVELRDMSVSQKITPRMSAKLVGSTVNCAYFNPMNRSLLVAAIGLGIFQSNLEEVPIMKNSTMTMARTHEGVVSGVLYNNLFKQVRVAKLRKPRKLLYSEEKYTKSQYAKSQDLESFINCFFFRNFVEQTMFFENHTICYN